MRFRALRGYVAESLHVFADWLVDRGRFSVVADLLDQRKLDEAEEVLSALEAEFGRDGDCVYYRNILQQLREVATCR